MGAALEMIKVLTQIKYFKPTDSWESKMIIQPIKVSLAAEMNSSTKQSFQKMSLRKRREFTSLTTLHASSASLASAPQPKTTSWSAKSLKSATFARRFPSAQKINNFIWWTKAVASSTNWTTLQSLASSKSTTQITGSTCSQPLASSLNVKPHSLQLLCIIGFCLSKKSSLTETVLQTNSSQRQWSCESKHWLLRKMAKEPWTWLSQILCQTLTRQLLPQVTRVRQSITWGEERPTISPQLSASSDLALHRQQSKMMTRFCRSISTRWTQKLYSKEQQTLRSPRITRVKLQGSSSSCQLKASSLRALKAELWAFKS